MGILFFGVLLVILSIYIAIYFNKIDKAKDKTNQVNLDLEIENQRLSDLYNEVCVINDSITGELNKVVHQKKSSEVRLGKVGENLAPFTDGWPWDPNNFRFIGSPIDGIQFTEDRIYLIEIKTGKARLSKYQAKFKDLIRAGKITFATYRIGEEGTEVEEFPIEKEFIK